MPEGLTVAQMLKAINVDTAKVSARVSIGGKPVPRHMWDRVRPKPGHVINVRAVPRGGGGGGKNPLRTVLTIAVFAAASWAASAFATNLALAAAGGGVATSTQVGIASGLIKVGVGAVGSLLVNAVAPPPKQKMNSLSAAGAQKQESQTLFIQGARNRLMPFGFVPVVLGTHRIFPDQCAKWYTETAGDKQYVRQLFCWGQGLELTLEEEKIGDTLLSSFAGVEKHHILDGNSTQAIPLFPARPDQEDLQILLTSAGGWSTRTTADDIDEISVDVTFPRGLVRFDDQGQRQVQEVAYEVAYSPAGADTWTTTAFSASLAQTSTVRRNHSFQVAKGEYDVRVRRTTTDTDDDQIFDQLYWTALRTFTFGNPVLLDGLGITAMRMLATDQLNGIVDQYNAIVSNHIPDWDADTETWITRKTSNPASIYRYILQGPLNDEPLPDSRLDLDPESVNSLQQWHEYCTLRGLEYNAVVDYETKVDDICDEVLAAGRASRSRVDGKYGAVIDRANEEVVQEVSPRKSWGYQLEKAFPDIPHAFIVQFTNKEKGYIQDEIIVYDDGYDKNNADKFQRLELSGVCSAAEAYIHGREHIATARLQPEVHSFSMDVENLVANRGDRLRLANDVIGSALGSGRVKALVTQNAQMMDEDGEPILAENGDPILLEDQFIIAAVTLDEPMMMEADKNYSMRFWLSNGTSLLKPLVTAAGTHATVTLEEPMALDAGPEPDDHFMFFESEIEPLELVVQQIEPGPDMTARLRCVAYAPGIYTAATGAIPDFNSNVSFPPELKQPLPPAIVNIQTGEEVQVLNMDGSISNRMVITLRNENSGAVEPYVRVRMIGEDDFSEGQVVSKSPERIVLEGFEKGNIYDIRVYYRRAAGSSVFVSNLVSPPAQQNNVLFIGTGSNPPDVENFAISVRGDVAYLTWDRVDVIDLAGYEIRFSPSLTAPTWEGSIPLPNDIDRTITAVPVPSALGSYLIKAYDRSVNWSTNAAIAVTNIGALTNFNFIHEVEEHDAWGGTFDDTEVVSGQLKLDGSALQGSYVFEAPYDLGAVYTSTLSAFLDIAGESLSDLFDSDEMFDSSDDFDGVTTDAYSVILQVRTTNDDPLGTPTWSDWKTLTIGDYTARAFAFRLLLESFQADVTPVVISCTVKIDMPDRVWPIPLTAVPDTGARIAFDPPFRERPEIGLMTAGMQTGDYYEIDEGTYDETGFDIIFKNSAGAGIERTLSGVAKGFGYEFEV